MKTYNVSSKSVQEARYHDAANDVLSHFTMAGAYPTERVSPSPLLSYSDDSPSYRQNVGLKLCVSVSPTTGQRGASRVGASCLLRTSRKRQHEKCNARTCRWQVNGTFFLMKLTCADAIKPKQTHVSAGMLRMTL